MELLKKINLEDDKTLEIYYETDPMNPRESEDNLTTVVVFHNRYDFGDSVDFKSADFSGWSEMETHIGKTYQPLIIKPLYMYEHSGVTIATRPFNCSFDSGQIGFVFITQKSLDTFGFHIKDNEKWSDFIERLSNAIEEDIKTLDDYLTGNCYGYQVKSEDDKIIESCWGFFGDDFENNGLYEHAGVNGDLLGDL